MFRVSADSAAGDGLSKDKYMDNFSHRGFETLSIDTLDEYRSRGIYLRHMATGAEVYKVENDDAENVFAFAFKTPPPDDTGVPHILEHTVLCGSRHYPLKDPFLVLLKGSTHTYLNAVTYPDKTIYPAASTVEADYRNLLRVYGDAVFFPLLKKEAFEQEGHRLELDEQGRLVRAGVVLNEMKGSYSSAEAVAGDASLRYLFPDTPYHWDSGGDPRFIPTLTYEAFRAFHRQWYHPSNVRVFLYGNSSLDETLAVLDGEFFSHFQKKDMAAEIPLQTKWNSPRSFKTFWNASSDMDEEGKSTVSMNWLWDEITSPDAVLSSQVLSSILLGHSGAPLQKSIVESGLGEDISPVSGLETDVRQMVFSAALRGMEERRVSEFEHLVMDTLEKQVKGGLDTDLVEGAMRMVEFRSREIRGGSPFGMRLMKRALRGWMHGRPPVESLAFEQPMARLRRQVQPGFFEEMIRVRLLENPHRSTVTVSPDPSMQKALEKQDREELDSLHREMQAKGPEEAEGRGGMEELRQSLEKMRQFQEEPDSADALARIPFLSPSDLPSRVKILPLEQGLTKGLPWFRHDTFANGVAYLNLAFDVSGVEAGLQSLLPLLGRALTEVGLPGRPHDAVARELALKTGGLGCSLEASSVHPESGGGIKRHLFVHLKALAGQWKEALALTLELLEKADFSNKERLKDLLLEMRNDYRAAVVPSGHAFAALRSSARHSRASSWEDLWYGVSQLQFLQQQSEKVSEKAYLKKLSEDMTALRKAVFSKDNAVLAVTADADFAPEALNNALHVFSSLSSRVPASGGGAEKNSLPQLFTHSTAGEGLAVSSAVSFSALSIPVPLAGTEEHALESLLAHILNTGFLWENIRMKGGAYGASVSVSGMEGTFTFTTYRDPHIVPSLRAFRDSLEWAAKTLDEDTLRVALIGAVGKELRPLGPGEAGFIAFKRQIYGLTDAIRQHRRACQLAATAEQIRSEAARLLSLWDNCSISVIAGSQALDDAARKEPVLSESRIQLPG